MKYKVSYTDPLSGINGQSARFESVEEADSPLEAVRKTSRRKFVRGRKKLNLGEVIRIGQYGELRVTEA